MAPRFANAQGGALYTEGVASAKALSGSMPGVFEEQQGGHGAYVERGKKGGESGKNQVTQRPELCKYWFPP